MGAFLCKNRAELLMELASYYKIEDKEEDLQYLFIFTYSSGAVGGSGGDGDDQWNGRVKVLTDKLQFISDKMKHQQEDVFEVKKEINTLKSSITDLHRNIDGVKADVGKKVDTMKTDMSAKLDTMLEKMDKLYNKNNW